MAGVGQELLAVPLPEMVLKLALGIADAQKALDEKPDLYRMAPVVMDEFVRFVKKTVKEQASQEMIFGLIDRFFDEVKPSGV